MNFSKMILTSTLILMCSCVSHTPTFLSSENASTDIPQIIQSNLSKFEHCSNHQETNGHVVLKFKINGIGLAEDVSVVKDQNTISDPKSLDCYMATLKTIQFPAVVGDPIESTYSF